MPKNELNICNNYWTDSYNILKDHGNGFLVVKLRKPIPYKDDFPQRHHSGNNMFLINTNL